MQNHLAFQIFLEQPDHIFLYLPEDLFGVSHQAAGNCFDDRFKHQQVLHFSNVGNEDVLVTQIVYLSLCTTITVNDTHRFQCVEILQLAESFCRFDHFLAASHRFDHKVGEDKRVETVVDAVGIGTFDKEDWLATSEYIDIDLFGKTVVAFYQLIIPNVGIGIVIPDPYPFALRAGGGEIDIMSHIDVCTDGAQSFYLIPQ